MAKKGILFIMYMYIDIIGVHFNF